MGDQLKISGGGAIRFETTAIESAAMAARTVAAEARSIAEAIDRIETDRPVPRETDLIDAITQPVSYGDDGRRLELSMSDASRELREQAGAYENLADQVIRARNTYLLGEDLAAGWMAALRALNIDREALGLAVALLLASPLRWEEYVAQARRAGVVVRRRLDSLFDPSRPVPLGGLLATTPGVSGGEGLVDFLGGILTWRRPLDAALVEMVGRGDAQRQAVTWGLVAVAGALDPTLRDGPVRIRVVQGKPVDTSTAPGASDLIDRVPDGDPEDGRVRVDVVQHPDGSIGAMVYIGGTDGAPGQPWDNASNGVLSAGQGAGSQRATEAAIRAALEASGLPLSTPLTLVGYSQGGLVASRITESGEWNVAGVMTVGSPGTWIDLPAEIPHLAIQHDEDAIAALNGSDDRRSDAVVVSRPLLDGRVGDDLFAAHHLADYSTTAGMVDDSTDAAVRHELDPILAAASGTVISSTTFAAERVKPTEATTGR